MRTDFYQVPLPVVLTDAKHGEMSHFELVTVQVEDSDGATGLGYTYAVNSGAEAFAVLVDRYLAPAILGAEVDRTEHIWQQMWWAVHYAGRGGHATSAISAVDIALWDLRARRAKQPLWRFLGGYDPKVPVYAGGIDLEFSIEELLAQADRFREEGFRAIKMKVGRRFWREDVERVARMREHVGDDFPLMVDANMGWTADHAIKVARALSEFDLVWVEEPTIPDDVAGHARVLRDGGVAVATGENLHTLYEFARVMGEEAVSFPQPDICNVGGVSVFRKVATLAEAHNLPVSSHGAHDVTVHLMAAAPNRTFMETHGFGLDRFLTESLKIVDGAVIAPERPGHGLTFDFEALRPYRIGTSKP
ncbi:mandelate racemase/muconate lactonizing enzyme family protein [Mycolicibacterium sp. YH-1]|uniref:mandelate racemase/muconate lactonizing enzyme family protein n=1 Tax=Mycolicibacterium sp. YH-1 TaxID=2908837 RepID=UPI001F4C1BF1|nr:mandelate racemase/muconate lactonizing enzyme family protein [Mycolicibacterium sp. YH-1]UNB54447.1 mandelate racemase/muconate lactonizing enzyme family protein [Mycolicibacterium sp. YH-1]